MQGMLDETDPLTINFGISIDEYKKEINTFQPYHKLCHWFDEENSIILPINIHRDIHTWIIP